MIKYRDLKIGKKYKTACRCEFIDKIFDKNEEVVFVGLTERPYGQVAIFKFPNEEKTRYLVESEIK